MCRKAKRNHKRCLSCQKRQKIYQVYPFCLITFSLIFIATSIIMLSDGIKSICFILIAFGITLLSAKQKTRIVASCKECLINGVTFLVCMCLGAHIKYLLFVSLHDSV